MDNSDATDDGEADGDENAVHRLREEAKKHRLRLREVETERDQLRAERDEARAERDADRRAIIDHAATINGIDPRLLDVAGLNVCELLDEAGRIDLAAVSTFLAGVQKELKLQVPMRPRQPNPAQGQGNSRAAIAGKNPMTAAFTGVGGAHQF